MDLALSRRGLALLGFILAVYFALGALRVRTSQPFCDEGWFASPAVNLLRTGAMSTTVLDPTATWLGRNLEGIHQYTYWTMPLYPVSLSLWFRLAGVGLEQMRLMTLLWGGVALLGWFVTVRILSGSEMAAIATVAVLAVDFQVQTRASLGRMDTMCAAFTIAAAAAYLLLRERRLMWAVLAANAAVAAAGLTHPAGIIALVWLVFLCLYYDRSRLTLRHVAAAAVPHLVGALAWGLYILQAPQLFLKQFLGNASGRWQFFSSPLASIRDEIELRYLDQFGLSARHHGAERLLGIVLLVHFVGWIGMLAMRDARRRPGNRALLFLSVSAVGIIGVIDGLRLPHYLAYTIPANAAVAAAAFAAAWQTRPRWRLPLAGIAATLLLVQLAANGYRVYQNPLGRNYRPTVAYLHRTAPPGSVILGSAELAFGLGFDTGFSDDFRLGAKSGTRPDFIVMDDRYKLWIPRLESTDPEAFRYTQRLLNDEFQKAFETPYYAVYRRR